MDITETTAIWGAVTGSLGLAVAAWREWRDRPSLVVTATATVDEDGDGWLSVRVANTGRRPTTVMAAGYQVAVELSFEVVDRPEVEIASPQPRLPLDDGEPRVVPPGEVTQYEEPLDRWPAFVPHADLPLRAYAVDVMGHVSWAGALPMLRLLLESGWEPPGAVPDAILARLETHIPALPVEPRWKLWKPVYLRKDVPPVPSKTNMNLQP